MNLRKDIVIFFLILFSGLFLGIFVHEAYHFLFASQAKEICLVLPGSGTGNLFEIRGLQTEFGASETNAMLVSLGATMIWIGIARATKIFGNQKTQQQTQNNSA